MVRGIRRGQSLGPAEWENRINLRVDGSWSGWDGDTLVQLTDGSVWRQTEYYYEYRYAYRPEVFVKHNKMHVKGMRRGVRVRRLA